MRFEQRKYEVCVATPALFEVGLASNSKADGS